MQISLRFCLMSIDNLKIMVYTRTRMINPINPKEIEERKEQLLQDIKFIDGNLFGISSLIIKELNIIEALKGGINLYKLEGISLDRKNNCGLVSDLTTFERQLSIAVLETVEKITLKSEYVKRLTDEHTRISAIKKDLESKYNALTKMQEINQKASQKSTSNPSSTVESNRKK